MKSEIAKIIVDCDAGTDDAVALIMLIEAHKMKKIEIKAITCVSGNTFVDNVIYNVFRTLNVCEASDVSNLKHFIGLFICNFIYFFIYFFF